MHNLAGLAVFIFAFQVFGLTLAQAERSEKLSPPGIFKEVRRLAESAGDKFNVETGEPSDIYLLKEIAILQAQGGDQSSAVTLFDQLVSRVLKLEHYSLPWKIGFLGQIASAQVRAGFSEGSRKTFQRAIQLAANLRGDDASSEGKVDALLRIAVGQFKSGDRAGGENTLGLAIQDLDALGMSALKIRLIVTFALHGIENGQIPNIDSTIKDALKGVDSIEGARERAIVVRDIAILQALVGDGQGAKGTFQKLLQARAAITGEWADSVPMYNMIDALKISEALFKSGRKDEADEMIQKALATAAEHPEDVSKSEVWWRIAVARAKGGDIQGALKAVSISQEGIPGGNLPEEIVEAQIKAGDLQSAYQSASRVSDNSRLFGEIASAQAAKGDIRGALKTIDVIKQDLSIRSSALRVIAAARVAAGEEKQALEWARNQKSPIEQAYALLGIAEGLLNQKKKSNI